MSAQYPVTVWEYPNYGGQTSSATYGNYSNISQIGAGNDTISSLKVAAFTRVNLFDNAGYGGDSTVVVGPKEIPNLNDYRGGLDDRVSSMSITRDNPSAQTKVACCQGSNLAYQCGEYQPESATCNSAMAEYCGQAANISDPICKTWCRDHPAQCDRAVIEHCAVNPSDPYCTCVNSPANTKGVINPKCADRACLNSGYLTTTMQQTSCPAQITCEIKNTLINNGVSLANTVPMQQNCGGTGNSTVVTTEGGSRPTGVAGIVSWARDHWIITLLFIFLVLAALIAGVYLLGGSEE